MLVGLNGKLEREAKVQNRRRHVHQDTTCNSNWTDVSFRFDRFIGGNPRIGPIDLRPLAIQGQETQQGVIWNAWKYVFVGLNNQQTGTSLSNLGSLLPLRSGQEPRGLVPVPYSEMDGSRERRELYLII
jgi:hypothetical protein